jgi:hypothetical protein
MAPRKGILDEGSTVRSSFPRAASTLQRSSQLAVQNRGLSRAELDDVLRESLR